MESLAVGRESFVETFRKHLGLGANYWQIQEFDCMCALRESAESYEYVSDQKTGPLRSIFPVLQEHT